MAYHISVRRLNERSSEAAKIKKSKTGWHPYDQLSIIILVFEI